MSFLVEDGTGLSASNSYASVAEFRSYWTDRGTDYSATLDAAVQAALIQATDFIDKNYRNRFKGLPTLSTQALCFPRYWLYDQLCVPIEGVPTRLKYATIEYAKRALVGELQPDPEMDVSGLSIKSKLEQVGPIRESVEFLEGSYILTKFYPAADYYLTEFITTGGGTIRA